MAMTDFRKMMAMYRHAYTKARSKSHGSGGSSMDEARGMGRAAVSIALQLALPIERMFGGLNIKGVNDD